MPRCDIVIPVWNQLEHTRKCIESIVKNTRYPYRLILIDNASDNATRSFLESIKGGNNPGVLLARNEANEGFIKAANKGMSLSDSEYVCLLNNDTIVTENWLSELVKAAESDPKVGIANPSSNNLGQKIPAGVTLEKYARSMSGQSGRYVELMACVGFCMLIKREVIRGMGSFDEIYGMGNFEDTDFSMRAKKIGYICVRALASYVYHHENVSFGLLKGYDREFKRNRKIFEDRWGRPERLLFVFFGNTNIGDESLPFIEGQLKKNNWVHVAYRHKKTLPLVHSNVRMYDFTGNFTLKVFLKILFKKKRFDKIYCDDDKFLKTARLLRLVHRAGLFRIPAGK